MKVFISWSGERSQRFAKALHEWLPMVLQSTAPWLSHADIAAGERWADTVAKELEASDFGITCVTRENITSPWIHFEAGALAKRMQEGRVIPLLLDIEFKDISGPLAQFQAKKAERDGILGVVNAINDLSQVKVSEILLPKQFEALWPTLERQINEIPAAPAQAARHRSQNDILEELVANVRGLDAKMRENMEDRPFSRPRRMKLRGDMGIEARHLSEEITRGNPSSLLMLMMLSLLRDDIPWLYDLGVEAYQQTVRKMPGAREARARVLIAIKALRHSRWFETSDSKEAYFLLRDLASESVEIEELEPPPKRANRKTTLRAQSGTVNDTKGSV